MPYDMQKIIMTGVMPAHYQDANPSPFTTITPKDEHRKKFKTMYGGLFTEVFEKKEFETYGHFTFNTTTNKITKTDTTAQTVFLIDPVAFAYDFGARMYDARLGIFTSIDPLASKYPSMSPYAFAANNPVFYIDDDGKEKRTYLIILTDKGYAVLIKTDANEVKYTINNTYGDALEVKANDIEQTNVLDLRTNSKTFGKTFVGKEKYYPIDLSEGLSQSIGSLLDDEHGGYHFMGDEAGDALPKDFSKHGAQIIDVEDLTTILGTRNVKAAIEKIPIQDIAQEIANLVANIVKAPQDYGTLKRFDANDQLREDSVKCESCQHNVHKSESKNHDKNANGTLKDE